MLSKCIVACGVRFGKLAKVNQSMVIRTKTSLVSHSTNIRAVEVKSHSHIIRFVSSDNKRRNTVITTSENTYEGEVNDNGVFHGHGLMRYKDGDTYEGMFENGIANGFGVFKFAELGTFTGEVVNEQIKSGVLHMIDGDIYEGSFLNDTFSGHGRYTYKESGKVYDGEFLYGLRHGVGTLTDPSGETYSGGFKEDLPHGHGLHRYQNGDTFDGMHVDGEWSEGRFTTLSTGVWYSGSFQDGDYHGQGELSGGSEEEDRYQGGFREGKYHGRGCLTRKGEFEYEGDWLEGRMTGRGAMTDLSTGAVYTGEFVNDRFHGSGVLVTEGGDVEYRGEFLQGARSGHGVERRLSSGESFDGQWSGDLRHGHGAYSSGPGGLLYEGSWVQGEICGHGEMTTSVGDHYLGEFLEGQYHGFGLCSRLGAVDRTVAVNIALAEGRAAETRASSAETAEDRPEGGAFDPNCPATPEEEARLSLEWRQQISSMASAHVSSLYEGDFLRGLQHGEGKLVYPNGSQYTGSWAGDKMHGYGVLRDAEGEVVHQGRFEEGVFAEHVEVPMFLNTRGLGGIDNVPVSVVRDKDFGAYVRRRFEREARGKRDGETGGDNA